MPAGKVNLYRVLCQLETEEEQINFLRKHKLIPEAGLPALQQGVKVQIL